MFIWGTKGSVQQIGYLMQECPSCESGPFAVHQAKKKFTLYFIPTFSYSNKQYLECLSCHDSFEVPSEMKPSIERNLLTQAEFSDLAKNARLAEPELDNPRYLEEPGHNNTDKSEEHIVPKSLDSIGLSNRVLNCLEEAGITQVREVIEMSDAELLAIDRFGKAALVELRRALAGGALIGSNVSESRTNTQAGPPVSNVPASKYCTNCGENHPLITNFCSKCGTALSNSRTT